jgi:hypothetical protein
MSQGTPFVMFLFFFMVFVMTFSVAETVSYCRRNVKIRCHCDIRYTDSSRQLSNYLCASLISCCLQLPSYLPLYGAREVDGLVNTMKLIGVFVCRQRTFKE